MIMYLLWSLIIIGTSLITDQSPTHMGWREERLDETFPRNLFPAVYDKVWLGESKKLGQSSRLGFELISRRGKAQMRNKWRGERGGGRGFGGWGGGCWSNHLWFEFGSKILGGPTLVSDIEVVSSSTRVTSIKSTTHQWQTAKHIDQTQIWK